MDECVLLAEYHRTGSEEAFTGLVRQYLNLVYSAARRQVVDPGLAEDVTQAVFLVLNRKARFLRPNVVLSTWLLATTHLCSRDALKRRARRDKHEARAAQMISDRRTESAEWERVSPVIDQAMASLARSDRDVLVLRFWEDKSNREVGQALGISENAATKRIARALEKLRPALRLDGTAMSFEVLSATLSGHVIQNAPAHLIDVVASVRAASSRAAAIAKGARYAMQIAKVKTIIVCAAAGTLAVGIAIPVMTHGAGQSQGDPENAPTTAVASNAADFYRQAIELINTLKASAPENSQFTRYQSGQFDNAAGAFFTRHVRIADLIQRGAATSSCDWGQQAVETRNAWLTDVRSLSRFMSTRSKYAMSKQDVTSAANDILAEMSFARHLGYDLMIISKLVEVAIESQSIDDLAVALPLMPKEQLKSLPQRLDRLPKSTTLIQVLTGDFEYTEHTRQMSGQQVGLLGQAMLDGVKQFYQAIGPAVGQPPAEFDKTVDAESAKYAANLLVGQLAPSIKAQRRTLAATEAKQAMLRVAIDVLLQGDGVVAKSRDPFGDGPFVYTKTGTGFELASQFQSRTGPVKLVVGGK